jgi:elongation factor Ts
MIAHAGLRTGPDIEALKKAKVGSETIADAITSAIATIGENMSLRRVSGLEVGQGVVASYVHNQVIEGLGKIGVLVALESAGKADELQALGRKLAMHIAAANPQALDASALDPSVITRERGVLSEKAKAQGKPANVVDKIVESGLKTFYKEVCLVDQAYIHEPNKSVAQAVKESEGVAGGPIRIAGYVRYALGEGIDRPGGDFAGDVAAAARKH